MEDKIRPEYSKITVELVEDFIISVMFRETKTPIVIEADKEVVKEIFNKEIKKLKS